MRLVSSGDGILRAETMRFRDEVSSSEDIGLPKREKPAPETLKSLEKLITDQSRTSLRQAELKDRASERFLKLIARKRKSRTTSLALRAKSRKKAPAVDLLEVLR